MEALAFSMVTLTFLRSSAAVSRSFISSVKRVLFSSVICSVPCGGVSGIGVSGPLYGSAVFLGGVGSIAGVAFGGGWSGDPAATVPYFLLFWVSVSSGLKVLVSRALVGHGVCSALFLTSVGDLGRPASCLGAGGAGFSCWVGGVHIIVLPPFLLTVVDCFEALMARVVV